MTVQYLIDLLGEARLLIGGGLLIGLLFGFFAQRSRFCLRAAVIEFWHRKFGEKLSVWLLAVRLPVATERAAPQPPATRSSGAPVVASVLAGLVLVRQRPGSAKGVCFITLEDETGVANIVVWPHLMERFRPVVMGARLMEVRGRVEMDDGVVHLIAAHLVDASDALAELSDDILAPEMARADHQGQVDHIGSRHDLRNRPFLDEFLLGQPALAFHQFTLHHRHHAPEALQGQHRERNEQVGARARPVGW